MTTFNSSVNGSGRSAILNDFPQTQHWTATQVLTWIAFGRAETRTELRCRDNEFYRAWRSASGDEALALLDARGAAQPFYPIQMTLFGCVDGQQKAVQYPSAFASPRGPQLARAIRAEWRRRLGNLVTYAQLAEMLKRERNQIKENAQRLRAANVELLAAIWDQQVTARGVRGPSPGGMHEQLPREVAMRPIRFREDQTEPDPIAPIEAWMDARALPVFSQVFFEGAEILRRWPPTGSVRPNSAADDVRLRKWLEIEMRASPNASTSKEQMKLKAKAAGLSFSGAGFIRAWRAAVISTGASGWGKPGRKPQATEKKSIRLIE